MSKHTHAFGKGSTYPLALNRQSPLFRLLSSFLRNLSNWLERVQVNESIESFRNGAIVGEGCRIGPNAWCANMGPKESITIGRNVVCKGILRCENWIDARLVIGDNVYIGDDCIISCSERIEIGRLTLLAHGVQIFDNDSHPINPLSREQDYQAVLKKHPEARSSIACAPVCIGERAWIGFNAIIMKGVRIGECSIVAAGSVVVSEVPPYSIVAGNPARVVRQIAHDE